MLRTNLLLLSLLCGMLIFASCSDTGTDSGDNGGEPVEPTAAVNNPSDGETLEGEVTFSIGGEAENGFDEARIFVNDEEIGSVNDPSLPFDQTIDTRNFDNGDYDLRAELDVAESDTSVEVSISTTFENYMVTMETDGFFELFSGFLRKDFYQLMFGEKQIK